MTQNVFFANMYVICVSVHLSCYRLFYMIQYAIFMHSKADISQLNLLHGTKNRNRQSKEEKQKTKTWTVTLLYLQTELEEPEPVWVADTCSRDMQPNMLTQYVVFDHNVASEVDRNIVY